MIQHRNQILSLTHFLCLSCLLAALTWISPAQAEYAEDSTGELVVNSIPDHGEVFLGMERIGSCPLSKRLPSGTFPLLVRQGTKVWQGTAHVEHGKIAKVAARLADPSKEQSPTDTKALSASSPSWFSGHSKDRAIGPGFGDIHKDFVSGTGVATELGAARAHAMALSNAVGELARETYMNMKGSSTGDRETSTATTDQTIEGVMPLAMWRWRPSHMMAVLVGKPKSGTVATPPFLAYGAGTLLGSSARESVDSAQIAALASALCQSALPKGIAVSATVASFEDRHEGDSFAKSSVHAVLKTRLKAGQQSTLDIESDWSTSEQASTTRQPGDKPKTTSSSSFSWNATIAVSAGKNTTRIHVKDGVGFPEPGTSSQAALGALIDAMDALGAKVQWLETEIVNGAPVVTVAITPPPGRVVK